MAEEFIDLRIDFVDEDQQALLGSGQTSQSASGPTASVQVEEMRKQTVLLENLLLESQNQRSSEEGEQRRVDRDSTSALGRSWAGRAGSRLADSSVALAGNRTTRVLDDAAKGLSGVFSSLGVVGRTAGAALTFFTGATRTAAQVVDSFAQAAARVAPYSGPISTAQARAEVTNVRSDIREAQVVGDEYADLINAQTDLRKEFRELMLPIKEIVVGSLADFLRFVSRMLETIRDIAIGIQTTIVEIGSAIVDAITLDLSDALDHITGIPDAIQKAIEEANSKNRDQEVNQFWVEQLNALDQIQIPGPQAVPPNQNAAVPAPGQLRLGGGNNLFGL